MTLIKRRPLGMIPGWAIVQALKQRKEKKRWMRTRA